MASLKNTGNTDQTQKEHTNSLLVVIKKSSIILCLGILPPCRDQKRVFNILELELKGQLLALMRMLRIRPMSSGGAVRGS